MYPVDTAEFHFSQGWLERFKSRHGIKTHRRFGESGSIDVEVVERSLESIREKLDQFPMKDVFNMDETWLFYRLQLTILLQQSNLKVRRKIKKDLQLLFVVMRMALRKFLYGVLASMLSHAN